MTKVLVRLVSSLHTCYERNNYYVRTSPTKYGDGVN